MNGREPAPHSDLDLVLQPASVLETVVVTATRTEERLGNVPASTKVITSEDIEASPALMADDVLRQTPSFSLFRRANSIAAQPTTQGVSLRGIGPSGQSRTLKVRLPLKNRKIVVKAKTLRVKVVIRARDLASNVRTNTAYMTLRAPR